MRRHFVVCLTLAVLLSSVPAFADKPQPSANTDPVYRQLRDIGMGSEAVTVKDFTLKRDAGKFVIKSGTFSFLTPVNGKVTGAIFSGDAQFILTPPLATESRLLSFLTKENNNELVETFHEAVFRFTDSTYDDLKKAGATASAAMVNVDQLHKFQDYARKTIRYNYDGRILQDVLSDDPGGFFVALINGEKYSSKLLYTMDPHGADDVAPEEISLRTFDDNKYGIWAAFHYSDEYAKGIASGTQANDAFDIDHQNLDTRIEKNGYLRGNALTTVVSNVNSLRAVDFNLFAKLRVTQVTDSDGNSLPFVQEDKERDYNYWVILSKPIAKGAKVSIRTIYEGEDAVKDEGKGNYFPVARETWFPNSRFGRYSTYDMRFSVPKPIEVVATGDLVSSVTEGSENVTVWKTDVPEAIAGFNLGEFKKMDVKLQRGGYTVESYANVNVPDIVTNHKMAIDAYKQNGYIVQQTSGGSMNTTLMMKKPLAEAQLAVDLYDYYFGPLPYKRVSMTQQTACNFGQSWPGLVYLPICAYFDQSVRFELGLTDFRGYWTIVAPHEVAHQWWGHEVGFNSYRDQWMSEGFAEFSASLFLDKGINDHKQYLKLWKDEYDLLTEKDAYGFRAIDAGPLVAGYRMANTKTGGYTYRRLVYPKGAYVLHMIRMMMSDMRDPGEGAFRSFMQDFTKTYANRDASTEDFKAMLEKHMLPIMNLDGNQKMDWFFNEYVYGTALPNYKFSYSFGNGPGGAVMLKFKVTQSNVDENFKMPVSLYIEMADGKIIRLGGLPMVGNKTLEQEIPLNGLPQTPKRAMINYNYDVLASGY